jgi:hypothetical protein
MAQDFNPDLSVSFDALQRPMPTPEQPSGSIIGSADANSHRPEEDELRHRPHAFALMHGSDGAKVAYGQLLWRIDELNLFYTLSAPDTLLTEDIDTWPTGTYEVTGSGPATIEIPARGGPVPITNLAHTHGQSGQAAVGGLNVKVPTINTEDGAVMSSGINFNDNDTKYHQLDGYGDVYLYWKVDLDDDDNDKVTKCWVTVDGGTAQSDIPAVDNSFTALDRQNTGNGTIEVGTYRVKLGSVNEDEQVTQDISSDVYWSIFLLMRVADEGS